MNFRRMLQFLSLPAALGLGTALVVACSSESPTESTIGQEQVEVAVPMAAPKKKNNGGPYDAIGSAYTCNLGDHIDQVTPGSGADYNGDGWVCKNGTLKKK